MVERQVRRRVGVVMGGSSGEREVSLRSGAAVAEALEARGYDVVRITLGDRFGTELCATLQRARLDAAFLALHGRLGEDGCVQGVLELAQIPYTGSSVLASALAMDKLKAKEMFRLHNVPTPPYYTVGAHQELDELEAVHGSFGFPVIVKPRGEGSSLGVTKAGSLEELRSALALAFEFDDAAIVERFVSGTEVNVGILDGKVLGAIEIVPKKGLYDYEAKYTPGMTEYHMPARLPPTRYRGVLNLAERAAQALGCTGAVRVDLLVTGGENEYVLEVNTLPGMTQTSLLPKIAAAAGYEFGDLCETILASARLHQPVRRRAPAASELRLSERGQAEKRLRLVKSAI
ncbi:D-alanine--D-alanine ligase [Sorangium cellulosum]|uniref:D-alanine--D-alanine ligase n=2 Tax=Sorangium cellulosum TaxID=56 RepID=A0A150P1N5_SORCE|nr:D-alanine--D-alanine ligase [Sorangium cellulosum]AGP32786.1 D-alanine--D-alanine ligase [Sorangium cellulosum So0157-2]KYF49039.1 D-alanine--D-alanine ligase [Sorangium cellulosum]